MYYLPQPFCSICNIHNVDLTDYGGHWLCSVCLSRAQAYERKVERRAERLYVRAEKAQAESNAGWERAHEMAEVIPMGQPILIGHYSEKADRRYRERIWRTQERAYRRGQEAEELARRAERVGKNRAISSDDPAAVLKLQAKLDALQEFHDEMTRINKIIRGLIGIPERMKTVGHHGTVDEINARFRAERERVAAIHKGYLEKAPELARLANLSESQARALLTPDVLNRIGFADYQLKNSSAEIRRLKKRIDELQTKQAITEDQAGREIFGDIVLERDTDENRLRLKFPGKPSAAIITYLKQNGFRWSPYNTAWQRQLNAAGESAAQAVIEFVQKAG